jgi:hypothetical protein
MYIVKFQIILFKVGAEILSLLSNGNSITGINKAIVKNFLLICNLNIVIIVVSSNNLSTLGPIMVTYLQE